LDFTPLTLDSKDLFDKFLTPFPYKNCSSQFTNLYMWRKYQQVAHAHTEDALFLRKGGESPYYTAPHYKDFSKAKDAYEALFHHMDTLGQKKILKDVERSQLDDLEKLGYQFSYILDRDQQEYIHLVEDLQSYPGKKFHKKRNHFNQFLRNYPYTIKYVENCMDDCLALAKQWFDESDQSPALYHELLGIEDLLLHWEAFSLKGIGVYVEGNLKGFTILEAINHEVLLNHVEKADKEVLGLYTFLVQRAMEAFGDGLRYTNREQDMGIVGLRKSKESYMPVFLEEKFIVTFTET